MWRQLAYSVHHPLAEPVRVAHAVLCQFDDSLGDRFVGDIRPLTISERRTCHLECDTPGSPSLEIKFEAVQEFGDEHDTLPLTGGSAMVSQPSAPGTWAAAD